MLWQTIIHITFVISAVALAAIDRFLSPRPAAEQHAPATNGQGPDGAKPSPAQVAG